MQSVQAHHAKTLDQWAGALEAHRDDVIAVESQEVDDRDMKNLTVVWTCPAGGDLDVNQFTLEK